MKNKKVTSRIPIFKTPSDKWIIPFKLDSKKQRKKIKKQIKELVVEETRQTDEPNEG